MGDFGKRVEGVSSVSLRLTAPSAEGVKGIPCLRARPKGFAIALWKPSPDHTSNYVGTPRWQVAAALSAAVTTTKPIEDAHNLRRNQLRRKVATQTPAALREGARGRGFSQRSRLPRILCTFPIPSYSSGEGVWGRGASLREAASPPESLPKKFKGKGRAREGETRFTKRVSPSRILFFNLLSPP